MLGTLLGPLPGAAPTALAPGRRRRARRRCSTPPRRPSACLPATCRNNIARRSSSATRSSTRTGSRRRPPWPIATAWVRCSTRAPVRAATCTTGAAGRRRPASPRSLLVRISVPGSEPDRAPRPDPGYGDQIQTAALPGVPAEAEVRLDWRVVQGAYGDGESYQLRRPHLVLRPPRATEPSRPDSWRRPRVAPAMVGLGLLEAVPEAHLLAPGGSRRSRRRRHLGAPQLGARSVARTASASDASAGRRSSRACCSRRRPRSWATWASPPRCSRRRTTPGARARSPGGPTGGTPGDQRRDPASRWQPTCACWRSPPGAPAPGGRPGGGAVSIGWLRPLPRPAVADRRGHRPARTGRANHLALHRPVAARHGRRARGPAPGVRGGRPGVAHAAAVGAGAGRKR